MSGGPGGADRGGRAGGAGGADRPGWRERLLGDRDRLGWWLLPLFLMVGLGGAVLAGSLVVVYYAQQVNQLEEETREAREDVAGASEEVRETADEALAAIEEESRDVREELAQGLPLSDALELGVVRLEVDTELEAAQEVRPAASARPMAVGEEDDAPSDADTGTGATDDGGGDPDGGEDGGDADPGGGDADPGADDGGGSGGDAGPDADEGEGSGGDGDPPATRRVPLQRHGAGFVVVVDEEASYIVTSLRLLDDPRTEDRVPADVDVTVRLPAGTTTGTVHSWDEEHDLLLLRAQIDNVEPLPWLDEDEAVAPGDRVVAVGATPGLEPVRVGSEVAGATRRAIVTTQPPLALVSGGPVVDLDGQVVGVASHQHAGLGGDPAVVPIRRLCDGLLSSCPD